MNKITNYILKNNLISKISLNLYNKINLIKVKLKKIISSFTPLFGNFLIKKANSNHNVGIHQDWSCVDEKNVRSFNVWVSLIDTNKKNGGLSIMPKATY